MKVGLGEGTECAGGGLENVSGGGPKMDGNVQGMENVELVFGAEVDLLCFV